MKIFDPSRGSPERVPGQSELHRKRGIWGKSENKKFYILLNCYVGEWLHFRFFALLKFSGFLYSMTKP